MSDKTFVVNIACRDVEEIVEVQHLLDRVSQVLKAALQLTETIADQDVKNPNAEIIEQAVLRFAKKIRSIYPDGRQQCINDQEAFQNSCIPQRILQ